MSNDLVIYFYLAGRKTQSRACELEDGGLVGIERKNR